MANHRYWRLLLPGEATGDYLGVSEVEMRSAEGGADQTGSGTPLSSGDYSASYDKSYAFDDSDSTEWATNLVNGATCWIGYDFGSGNDLDIVEVRVRSRITGSYLLDNYILQYSDDGTNWVSKYFWIGMTPFTTGGEWRTTNASDIPDTFELVPHGLLSNTYLPYTISASTEVGGYPAYKALDRLYGGGKYWVANAITGWLKIDLGVNNGAKAISYGIRANSIPEPNRCPKDFTLQGSNNDSDWDTLDTVTGEISWGSGELRTFTCDTAGLYRYYKLDVTLNNGDATYMAVGEFYLTGEPVTPDGTVVESIGVSDAITILQNKVEDIRDIVSTVGLSDAVAYIHDAVDEVRMVGDTVGASDVLAVLQDIEAHIINVVESVGVSDPVDVQHDVLAHIRIISETVLIQKQFEGKLYINIVEDKAKCSDNVGLTDSVVPLPGTPKFVVIADHIWAYEHPIKKEDYFLTIADAIGMTDAGPSAFSETGPSGPRIIGPMELLQ